MNGAGLLATVFRREPDSDWAAIGSLSPDGGGFLVFEDHAVTSGRSYGYRLGIPDAAGQRFVGEAWVEIPRAFGFALHGARPNPASRELRISFSLLASGAATFDLFGVGGRLVVSREVGALGPGDHVSDLEDGAPLPAGLYLIRVTRGGRSLTARAVLIQ